MSFLNSLDDFDELLSQPVASSTMTRWERKENNSAKTPGKRKGLGSMNSKTPGKTPGKGKAYKSDRFIPNRDAINADVAFHHAVNYTNNENSNPNVDLNSTGSSKFNSQLAETLFSGDDLDSRILAFKEKAPKPSESHQNNLRVLYTQNKTTSRAKRVQRHIASTPERILDAPDILDDYYLNLLHWSSTNMLAVSLAGRVYVWNADTGSIDMLCETRNEEDVYTSIRWMDDGTHIAIGTGDNDVQLWDVSRQKQVRSMKGHQARVGALSWNNHVLSSGSRDSMIFHHDVRVAQHHISTLEGHEQEICGLAWSPDGTQLASGGNDNMLCIWDANASSPRHVVRESQAAVKALAWCPFQKNLLATGSGTADRHIRFYNTITGSCVNKIDTNSQVCSLQWSKTEKEILSSHGFSQNQLTVWKYPSLVKVGELTGHTSRVLHTAVSPDGTTVCSAAADETLRFWKVWDVKKGRKTASASSSSGASRSKMHMRIR